MDLGPGDVVESVRPVWGEFAGTRIDIPAGSRATVTDIDADPAEGECFDCGSKDAGGIQLREYPTPSDDIWWCVCGWRRIGGSQADTVRHFAEDLKQPAPTKAPETVSA